MANVIVYTCVYNGENTISRTIESVINQTYQDFIYVIINNGSTDSTKEIVEAYCEKYKGKLYMLEMYHNDIRNLGTHFLAFNFIAKSSTNWATTIDADDEWTPDYLEKTVSYGEENDLHLVACGYDKVDSTTGETIKQRVLKENIIIENDGYRDDFVKYRGFCNYFWGKLFRISDSGVCVDFNAATDHKMYEDSLFTLLVVRSLQKNALKIGIIADSCIKYYVGKSSYSYNHIDIAVDTYEMLYSGTKAVLESFGEISKFNHDFLYAIYFSLMNDIIEWILFSTISDFTKLSYIYQVLNKPLALETFEYKDYDPQIRNLSDRSSFLTSVEGEIKKMANKQNQVLIDKVIYSICRLRSLVAEDL